MNLLNPAALLFAALVPVIVALYLLKVRRRTESVSTLLFWRKVAEENRRRALWQKLRRPLSLLLQLLLLALVLFALARPEWSVFRGTKAAAIVIVLDARARLQAALPEGGTRFDAARVAAGAWLDRASAGRPVALVTLSDSPRVAVPLSADAATARAALAAVAIGDATSPAAPAFALAQALLESAEGERRMVWISDEPPPAPKGGSFEVEWVRIGREADNVGLTRFALRARADSPDSFELFFVAANHGRKAASGTVEVSLDGRVVDAFPLALEAGAARRQTLALPSLASRPLNAPGLLTARWRTEGDKGDALAADDRAYAVAPRPRQLRVLLVTAGNAFLERCLAADENLRVEQLVPDAYVPRLAAAFDAVILDQTTAGTDVLADLPPGRFLFLGHSPLGPNGAVLDRPLVTEVDAADPLFRNADFRDVNFLRAVRLPASVRVERRAGWRLQAPIRALDVPLLVTGERESGPPQRFLATAFGVADSDLPLRVAFPLFLGNAVRWLANESGEAPTALRAGAGVTLASGESLTTEPVTEGLASDHASLPRATGPATVSLRRNGFYLRTGPDGAESWLAVCSLEDATSNLLLPVAAEAAAPTAAVLPPGAAWPPWMVLVLAALALSVSEWFLYHRRRTE